MSAWSEVHADAPDLATRVQARFDAHTLGLLATLRADGAPRIGGIEPLFALGEIWLGMMPDSRKDADVRRDPRVAVHSATIDKDVAEGDARVSGLAVLVEDEATFEAYRQALVAARGGVPEGTFPVYRIDVTEVMHLSPAGDHLVIESWTPARGYASVDRY